MMHHARRLRFSVRTTERWFHHTVRGFLQKKLRIKPKATWNLQFGWTNPNPNSVPPLCTYKELRIHWNHVDVLVRALLVIPGWHPQLLPAAMAAAATAIGWPSSEHQGEGEDEDEWERARRKRMSEWLSSLALTYWPTDSRRPDSGRAVNGRQRALAAR